MVYVDLLDGAFLAQAMEGVDTLYQLAAVFKNWAKSLEKPEKSRREKLTQLKKAQGTQRRKEKWTK